MRNGGEQLTVPVDITDPRIAKAYAHPLRIHILGMLDDRVASPSEIATELSAPLTHVSYHVRQLASLGLIKLVRTTPRRGAVEHHYTAQIRPKITDDAWGRTPEIVKKNLVTGWVEQVGAHVAAGAAEGGFDREEAHMTRSAMMLDEKGWKAISRELGRTLERIEKLGAEASARVKKKPDSGFRATSVIMHFEGPSSSAGLPEDAGIRRHRRRRAKTTA
ncbi:MAG: helix-turn-helix transcriptional regulator [Actinobacteria bacterium]|nr:MAG: helix-turn-helix transcriptional regulator [Actinomycetota bacterium]TML79179.1 MAG: helix-turn-helix transcriptional regulator [Actinomycetota bacterium]